MPITIHDLKNNKLYKKNMFMPNTRDHKRNKAVMELITPNYESSLKCMNLPFWINSHRFESYYIEKDVTFILSENGTIIPNEDNSQIVLEVGLVNCTRYICHSLDELERFGVDTRNMENVHDDMEAMVFCIGGTTYGHVIVQNRGNTIYDLGADYDGMVREILELTILLYNPKFAICRNEYDRKLYSKYGYNKDKLIPNSNIYVREGVEYLTEGFASTKLNAEIRFWQMQCNLLETIYKNFSNDNWMKHNFKKVSSKISKIPLVGWTNQKLEETKESIACFYNDRKSTLEFYIAIRAIELKEEYDVSEIVDEYISWVEKLNCPKELKIKTLNTIIDSYEESIKECEDNLNRYRVQSETKKRIENVIALSTRLFSIFGFLTGGPLGVLKSTVLKGILPKSRKQNVFNEAEIEAKITSYEKIVETLRDQRDKIQLEESVTIVEKEDDLPVVKAKPITEAVLRNNIFQTDKTITFLEGNDEVLTEANASYNAALKRLLYAERIKNQKEILLLYDRVKEDNEWIKYTYTTYDKYNTKNLIIDWSYYTQVFFKKNKLRGQKAADLFLEFMNRLLSNKKLTAVGYDMQTVVIPIGDWIGKYSVEKSDIKKSTNIVSLIKSLVLKGDTSLKEMWGNYIFLFTGSLGYMKIDFTQFDKADLPKFLQNIKKLCNNEPIVEDLDEKDSSTDGIVNSLADKMEEDSGETIEINNLTGTRKVKTDEIISKSKNEKNTTSDTTETSDEDKLVDNIIDIAERSDSVEDAMSKLNQDDQVKQIVLDLRSSSPSTIDLNPTRVARVRKLSDEFRKKEIYGKSIEEIIRNEDGGAKSLPEVNLPIDTINDEWHHLKFINHDKVYDVNEHIVQCLYHFSTDVTIPVGIREFNVENTTTSEDWIDTWTVACEDVYGKRFTLKFDVPRFENGNIMHLRGNDKTLNNQLINLPIIKTEASVCQMTSNYNKIFFRTYGTSTGKSCVAADRIIKTLNKMESSKDFEIQFGDNSRICSSYDLPLDYIDISSVVSKITVTKKEGTTMYKWEYYFNQEELNQKYGKIIDNKDTLCFGIFYDNKGKPSPLYIKDDGMFSTRLEELLCSQSKEFEKIYATTSPATRYTYSKASILNTEIPIAVMIGYYIGLIPMLDRAGIEYEVTDRRKTYDKSYQDVIKLSDAYIYYTLSYTSSMLLNGLKECDMPAYSIKEVGDRKMWLDCLDIFGGRLRADGLDMFYDLMMDPITKSVCRKYRLPEDYIDNLLYANMLLADNKYNKHTDITGNRYRSIECIAAYTYKALCNTYTQYRRELRAGREAKMSMKQSAVIDLLFADNTFGDLSALSDLLEYEAINATSFRGLSGMNSDRAYGLDKRTFDDSMINVLGMSTGFAGNVGLTRQNTIDMNIDSSMGYINKSNIEDMSITKTFCMTEALTPFGTTSDDPFRTAMTFIQTSKHGMRTAIQDPLLITNGADEALPYLTSNTFSFKAKNKGVVKEKTDEYMVLEYADKTTEVVDLREKILKNSDGGMYIAVKLDTDLKEGDHFKQMEIVAIDKSSYSANAGPAKNNSFNVGTFVKCAILNSDEGYEDSCIETDWLSNAMASEVTVNKEYTLPKDTNVYFMAKKGDPVQEGDPLLVFQNAFDEEDANMLIKVLSAEDGDGENMVAELGRITLKSKVTGKVKDIKIYRTVEIDELSPSLKKIVTAYEKEVNKFNKVLDKYDKEAAKRATATYKLEPTGKLKNAQDSVRIEFSLSYFDRFSVGDKAVCYSACKGVSKGVIAKGKEPYSTYRPEEKIHYIQSLDGKMGRMVGSIDKVMALNKVMVELSRQACEIMGIPWKYFDEY